MTRIEELEAEVARLKEQLQPYLDAEEAANKEQALKDRIQWLVDICIPRHNGRLKEEDKPTRHPKYTNWWNGASVTDFVTLTNGNICVDVRSYVGGGDYENEEITLLKEWLEIENPILVVQQWCVKETERLTEERKEYARQETARRIEALTKELVRLGGKT